MGSLESFIVGHSAGSEYARGHVRVLMLAQYFTPELTAGAARIQAFAQGLTARGHEVEVICEVPSHPRGVVRDGYGGRLIDRRQLDGFAVRYVWVPVSSSKTKRARLRSYGGYAVMASMAGAFTRRADVVLASSPPLPVAAAGAAVATRHRAPWVFDVRDLWPAAAVAVGELTGARSVRAAERLESGLYRSAAAVISPSAGSLERIAASTGQTEKLHLVPSGTTAAWLEVGDRQIDRPGLGIPTDAFLWTYAGNVGLAQDIGTAIETAVALGPEFHLLIVGDGPLRERLEQRTADIAPGLVTFTGLVPRVRARELMRASDALLVSLADAPGIEYAVPSKLYDCAAVARPIVVAARGEARRLATSNQIGISADPGDVASLAAAVRRLRVDPEAARELARRARAFAEENLRDKHIGRLDEILSRLATRG